MVDIVKTLFCTDFKSQFPGVSLMGTEGVVRGHPVCQTCPCKSHLVKRALMPHLGRSHEVANFSANPLISHLPAGQRGGAENVPKCIAIYLMVASATFETIWDAPHLAILKG